MRRLFCTFLSFFLLLGLLTACGSVPAASATSTAASTPAASAQSADETSGFTSYADYVPSTSVPVPMREGTGNHILVAYFSRADNTALPDDGLDGVTSASWMVGADGTISGSAKEVAGWIADETGGDLYAIQTAYTYPLDYDEAVAVGEGQDIDGYLPVLAGSELDLSPYDVVFLVYPIWHFTLPAPVRSFLTENPMPGKTVYAFATNAGSQFGSSIEAIAAAEPKSDVVAGLSVRADDVQSSRRDIIAAVSALLEDSGAAASDMQEDNTMMLTIGGTTFPVRPADSDAAREFTAMLTEGPVTVKMSDYSGFEKVGSLGRTLTASNERITTKPGDIMLYNGSNIVLFYGENTWDYTPIGTVTNLSGWETALGSGEVTAQFGLKN